LETVLTAALIAFAAYHFKFRAELQRKRENSARFSTRDTANQLRFVMNAAFRKKSVMSRAEYLVFRTIEGLVKASGKGHRVFAQTSLGEIIGTEDRKAFESINSKRIDILIIDPFGQPAVAVEYQGGGHYQGDAAGRDAVKKEALRKAGVAYVEVQDGESDEGVRRKVLDALGWSHAAAGSTKAEAG
jgi:hypothetical protein